jgi:hypothetical protein
MIFRKMSMQWVSGADFSIAASSRSKPYLTASVQRFVVPMISADPQFCVPSNFVFARRGNHEDLRHERSPSG